MTPTPRTLKGVFGVQTFERDVEPLARGRVKEMGANWVRLRALWTATEPQNQSPPQYQWGMTDSMITSASLNNLKPVVVVYTKPAWAATDSCGPVDKVPVERYGQYLTDLVERFDGDGIDDAPGSPVAKHWEIGNEPDLSDAQRNGEDYGSCFGDDPAAYARQLRMAYLAIKAADPEAQVLFGAVAYDRFHDAPEEFTPVGPFTFNFVRDTLEAMHDEFGTEPDFPFFDLLGFHNYNDYRNNWDGPGGSMPEIIGKVDHLRQNQLFLDGKFDLRDMPLFASEVGVPSAPTDNWTSRNRVRQASYIGRVMARSAAAGLAGAIWYTYSDSLDNVVDPSCANIYEWLMHGMTASKRVADAAAICPVNPIPGYTASKEFEQKAAADAFAVGATLLGDSEFVRTLTTAELGVPHVEAHLFTLRDAAARLSLLPTLANALAASESTISM